MSGRPWTIADQPPADWVNPAPQLPQLIGRWLWSRRLRQPAEAERFLSPDFKRDIPDPHLYLGMSVAVSRLIKALEGHEHVTVYGDYDADGMCATAIIVETLAALGGHVDWYLPQRIGEGYGLNGTAIEELARQGTTLLVTVDCGTTNVSEITHANTLGLDVIVLDHHQPAPETPPALVIINPQLPGQTYPWTGHSSGGIAYTLAAALLQDTDHGRRAGRPLPPDWEKWLLDLAAISTVADMVPLRDVNRTLVHFGLKVLAKTRRPGLQALLRVMGADPVRISEQTISWQIAPRLNAAGRLEHAGTALRLLLTSDRAEAQALADQLNQLNLQRQKLTELAVAEAMEQVVSQGDQAGYVAFAPHWSPGIIGLIAGRLADRLWRPVVVMTQANEQIVGSGRSVPGFDITAHLRLGPEHFLRFGGHAAACGFTLSSQAGRVTFTEWFATSLSQVLPAGPPAKPLTVDAPARLAELDLQTVEMFDRLGPYGVQFERPRFLVAGLTVLSADTVGQEGQHLRLSVRQDESAAKLIGFRLGQRAEEFRPGRTMKAVIEPSVREWNGRIEVQLKMLDLSPEI